MKWLAAGMLFISGCTTAFDVDIDEFSRLPAVDSLSYASIVPAQSHDYWELRFALDPDHPKILGSGGRLTREQLSPAQRAALDSTRSRTGFATGCLPGYCFKYIVAVNGAVQLFNTTAALAEFLGSIDSMEEAALTAHARGFYWDGNDPDSGYRETGTGWEIVARQLVRDCTPIQVDRVQLLVRRNGSIQELDREVYEKTENACI